MFWYISFLRPPPLFCTPTSPTITITPQIANDLRTELYPSEIDISYVWLPSPPTSQPTAKKLTTWRTESAYKPISVPCPAGVKEGDVVRLCLLTKARLAIALYSDPDKSDLEGPLPVVSAPITFTRSPPGQNKDKKSESIERAFLVSPSRRVVVREQTSFDLDKKMWDSGLGLSAWLVRLLLNETGRVGPGQVRECLTRRKCRVLELGTGTGFVSLMLQTALDVYHQSHPSEEELDVNIVATDLPSALPLIQHNISTLNTPGPSSSNSVRLQADVLDWEDESKWEEGKWLCDIVIMADVTYNTAVFPALLRTLRRVNPPLLVLGYKERDSAERDLWPGMERVLEMKLELVEKIEGAGGEPVEVWVGSRRGTSLEGVGGDI